MKQTLSTRILTLLLAAVMVLGMSPVAINAAGDGEGFADEIVSDPITPTVKSAEEDDGYGDGYYRVTGEKTWTLAPGIKETELILNNAAGTHRQVSHIVEIDIDNPYTKVMPSYKGMHEALDSKTYAVDVMSSQVAYAEANGYGNVVAAMNLSLSWYNTGIYLEPENAHLIGEPLGYVIMDGQYYENSQGRTAGAQTVVVINYDEKDGVARPDDIPKTEIRSTASDLTGWEEQVIPANFGFLVKDGVNQYSQNHTSDPASRSFVGIKANGDIVMVMNDGRQSPYSAGFNSYEMAELMIELGCVQAVNGDGGGSSTFLSQRPGEEIEINCSPSDGAERPTTHGILVISTAPADGVFARANITVENDYYTPGSTVTFSALGTDLVGTETEIPEGVSWQLKETDMGTIEDGVFVSNGTVGTATAQMVYNNEIVGECSVKIVIPTGLAFGQTQMTIPYGKEVSLKPIATINDGLVEVVLKESDITFEFSNETLGTLNGFMFTAVSEQPADVSGTVTATLNHGEGLVATATMSLGKGSEILFDFEADEDLNIWNTADVNGNDAGFVQEISIATREDGQVHDGEGSMRLFMNPVSALGIPAGGYGQLDLFLDEPVIVENAKSIGFWAYIPDEYEHCWIRVLYWYDPDGDGKFDKKNTVSVINQPEVYNKWDESGWKYFSVDVSAYDKIMIAGVNAPNSISYDPAKCDANNFRFIEFMLPHTNTNDLWKTYGTINGPKTIYIDNITADFSDAVDDREAPKFTAVTTTVDDTTTVLEKYVTPILTDNILTVQAAVSEDTAKSNATGLNAASAKAYVDGVEVNAAYSNGRINMAEVAVADGVHRVRFEIEDNAGNKAVVIRLVEVRSGVDASTVQLVPKDAALDRLYGGSLYWMDLKATDIETIQSVSMRVDLNGLNHWELAHTEYAPGFTGTYSIDEENNTADITITRTDVNNQTGEAVIASLPIRIVYFDTDIHVEGYTAESYWNSYAFWPYDLKVDVDMGKITYVEGYSSDVNGLFSNEEFSVDTEMYVPSSMMDPAFKAERGTAHVHEEKAVSGLEATCTDDGFCDRTFCEICDSIVAWGSVVEARGHNVDENTDGLQTCSECGKTFGYLNGEQLFGWHEIDGKVCYFDTYGIAANGEAVVDGITYSFVEFALAAPALVNDGTAYVGYWAGEQMGAGWHTLNGSKYFVVGIYVNVGIAKVALSTDEGYRWYAFDENGVWQENYNGIFDDGDEKIYAENGVAIYKGLARDDEGYYYYFNSQFKAVTNCEYGISEARTNGLLPAGIYRFDEEGRMIDPPVPEQPDEPGAKQGLIMDEDGEIRYYVDGVAQYAGVVQDEEGNFYYINSTRKAVRSCSYYIHEAKTNGLIPGGQYEFGADCRMIDPPGSEEPEEPGLKQGLILDEDGEIRYYVDGVAQYAGVVQDEEGNLYYINSTKKAVKNCSYYIHEAKTNGLIPAGQYVFGEDGRMIR